MKKSIWGFRGLLLLVMVAVVYLYYRYSPGEGGLFLACPFKVITGYDCPGCGSQRAFHSFLHGHFLEAWRYNALLLPGMLYALMGLVFSYRPIKHRWPRLYRLLFGWNTIVVLVLVALLYGVFRNI